VLTELITPAVFFDNNLCAFVICRIVSLTLEHGNSDAACFAYVWLGIIAGRRFGDYEDAFRFAQLGYDLLGKRSLTRYEARTRMCFAVVVPSWMPIRHNRDIVLQAFDLAYRMGDFTYAAYSGTQLLTNFLFAGTPLADAQVEAETRIEFAERARVGLAADIIRSDLQLIRTLRGLTDQFGSFNETGFDDAGVERHLASNPALDIAGFGYWTLKTEARFLAGDYASAIEASLKAEQLLWSAPAILEEAVFRFYGALSYAAAWDSTSPDGQRDHFEALTVHYRTLTLWAGHCPENFESAAALVSAEISRIEGRPIDAEELYEKAIRSARASGFIHNEAVAYEVAARFYITRGFDKFADAYLREARYCYSRWGADGKVKQLDELYPDLRKEELTRGTLSTIMAPGELLDLATVIKVSQAVSGEMVLETLIERVMRAAIEHAGAERGLLIVAQGDNLRAEAEATTTSEGVSVRMGQDTVNCSFPDSFVRYVMRTHEPALLDDPSSPSPLSSDRYFTQDRARSVLGLPLVNQSRLVGVLYLENSLAPHVFSADRIAVLKVLASQAAISLENTRLYHDLENREAKIRRLVDANIVAIVIWHVDGAIVSSNEAFLRMVQYDREDVASGRVGWRDMTPEEWRDGDERALAALRETGTVLPYEKELLRKDGKRVPVLVAGALFQEGGGEGVAFVLDLSEQKRTEAEIRALKDQLYRENLALRDEIDRASMFEEIVGSSSALKAVLSRIAKVAPTDSTVFISGETGTGKELIARAVHRRSRRSGRPFVSVNCAAFAPALISSELFGHEKGAFTGAVQRRLGRFELADGGTIFLDEVGELLPETQVTLLRVLQEREFERVGGTQVIRVDVRLIAATNRDLKAAVVTGAFRQDLFYRLNVFPIEAPPLRERKEDVLTLVEYFLHRYALRAGKKFRSIDKRALELFKAYDWPGNIRELQNVVERSVILSVGDVFSVDETWLSSESSRSMSDVRTSGSTEDDPRGEREIIEAALAESRGRVAGPLGAAAKLRVPPSTLESRIKALKIRKSQFKFR
jgi:PAS domain S-box-containing protein